MTPKERAVCVCFDGDLLLVIRRSKDGRHYSVLPGGGIEPGENPAAAVVRELHEETGMTGVVVRHLKSIDHPDRRAHYFLLSAEGGPLTLGGPEALHQTPDNRYSPTWIPIESLDDEPIMPTEAREVIRDAYSARQANQAPSGSLSDERTDHTPITGASSDL